MINVRVRKMEEEDLVKLASVHALCFSRQRGSYPWLSSQFHCYPVSHCFTAEVEGSPVGYAIWIEKSGIRKIKTLELLSIAVHPRLQGKGIGSELIGSSFRWMEIVAQETESVIGGIMVTTREDNGRARQLYRKNLGVCEVAKIPNYLNFGITEVILFRDLKGNGSRGKADLPDAK